MNKILTMALLFTGISLATFGQENIDSVSTSKKRDARHHRGARSMENVTPEQIAKMKTDRLDKKLQFTDKQRAQIYAVQFEDAQKSLAHREQMKALRNTYQQERNESQTKMDDILTSEQKQTWKQGLKSHKNRKLMHAKGRRADVDRTSISPRKKMLSPEQTN